jgi:hypothetical protein
MPFIENSLPISFQDSDALSIPSEAPIYGPPDPSMLGYTGSFVSPTVFQTTKKRKYNWDEKVKAYRQSLKLFKTEGSDSVLPEMAQEDIVMKGAPWDPVEDDCLLACVSGLATLLDIPEESFSRTDTLKDWPAYVAMWLNCYCHSEKEIRNSIEAKKRYKFLLIQRAKNIPVQSLPKAAPIEGPSDISASNGALGSLQPFENLKKFASYTETYKYAAFPTLIPTGRRMNVDECRYFSIREFERLMMSFMTMKKRPRLKPALHQIASANVALFTSPRTCIQAPISANKADTSFLPASPQDPASLNVPPPTLLSLLTNRKLNTTFHSSHESCIKKNAFLTGLHKPMYTATELALYKLHKGKMLQQPQAVPSMPQPPMMGQPPAAAAANLPMTSDSPALHTLPTGSVYAPLGGYAGVPTSQLSQVQQATMQQAAASFSPMRPPFMRASSQQGPSHKIGTPTMGIPGSSPSAHPNLPTGSLTTVPPPSVIPGSAGPASQLAMMSFMANAQFQQQQQQQLQHQQMQQQFQQQQMQQHQNFYNMHLKPPGTTATSNGPSTMSMMQVSTQSTNFPNNQGLSIGSTGDPHASPTNLSGNIPTNFQAPMLSNSGPPVMQTWPPKSR